MAAGRQKNFHENEVLDKATNVFWANGYSGTSMSDLTKAMGINKPSLYATFGNKETLFTKSIGRYLLTHGQRHSDELTKDRASKSLTNRLESYLISIAKMVTNSNLPKGCLVCNSTAETAGHNMPDKSISLIRSINDDTLQFLVEFFYEELSDGTAELKSTAITLANYLLNIQFGLSISGRNGASFEEQRDVIKLALSAINSQLPT